MLLGESLALLLLRDITGKLSLVLGGLCSVLDERRRWSAGFEVLRLYEVLNSLGECPA